MEFAEVTKLPWKIFEQPTELFPGIGTLMGNKNVFDT